MTEISIKEAWKLWWEMPTPSRTIAVIGFTVCRFIVVTALKLSDDPKECHY